MNDVVPANDSVPLVNLCRSMRQHKPQKIKDSFAVIFFLCLVEPILLKPTWCSFITAAIRRERILLRPREADCLVLLAELVAIYDFSSLYEQMDIDRSYFLLLARLLEVSGFGRR
jgi:hypothetical protein